MTAKRTAPTSGMGGFTLIEALMVIVIAAVLLAVAAPMFRNFTASQRVKTTSFDLYAALVFARSEAIKRRQTITIAPVSGTDWTSGWTVKTPTQTLRTQDAETGVQISTGATSVVYRMDGRLTSGSAIGVLIKPQIADASLSNRCIRIDLTGLPKSTTTKGTTCP